jgi:hypothetical protein
MDRGGRDPEVGVQGKPDARTHGRVARVAAEATVVTWSPSCQEKPLAEWMYDGPYRKPPLVGRGKHLKVDERSFVKELGKLAP